MFRSRLYRIMGPKVHRGCSMVLHWNKAFLDHDTPNLTMASAHWALAFVCACIAMFSIGPKKTCRQESSAILDPHLCAVLDPGLETYLSLSFCSRNCLWGCFCSQHICKVSQVICRFLFCEGPAGVLSCEPGCCTALLVVVFCPNHRFMRNTLIPGKKRKSEGMMENLWFSQSRDVILVLLLLLSKYSICSG